MLRSLFLQKISLRASHFGTLLQSKKYCNTNDIGKEDTQKQNKVNDDIYKNKSIEEKLKYIFEKKMKNDKYPLFSDYNTYEKWMPVRLIGGGYHELYKFPYYVNDNDLDMSWDAKLDLEELISNLSKGGKKPRILFHIDSHRKMCYNLI